MKSMSSPVKKRKSRSAALIQEMLKARGYIYPTHEYLAKADPDFLVAYNRLVGQALIHKGYGSRHQALAPKYRELVVCGILAHRGVASEMLVEHVRRAMRLGASAAEVLEAFEAAVVPGGAPTLLNGINALIAVDKDGSGSNGQSS
jgi:alkylhydroperoxidase/carboxymuconolactone decarboxylase family protein YurZ